MRTQTVWALAALCVAGCSTPTDPPTPMPTPITTSSEALAPGRQVFNRPGDLLIADQFNNRVIEVAPHSGRIVWSFGLGPDDVSEGSIIGVNDAQRVGAYTLMAGTGAPPGTEPKCPTGCVDNRVLLVDEQGNVRWQYGQFGVTGSRFDQLSSPVQATWLPEGRVLITDQGNQRVIEVDAYKNIVWQYGTTGLPGYYENQLNSPNSAELLANGHVLIADEGNGRALEVSRTQHIVKEFTAQGTASGVAFASRLGNGHTLMTDSDHDRIVEVNADDEVVWEFFTNRRRHSNENPVPTRAVRLANGSTLIADQFNHQVIEVDRDGVVVASFGTIDAPGFGAHDVRAGLNAPYDAKVVGDYTGLTPPILRHGLDVNGDEAER